MEEEVMAVTEARPTRIRHSAAIIVRHGPVYGPAAAITEAGRLTGPHEAGEASLSAAGVRVARHHDTYGVRIICSAQIATGSIAPRAEVNRPRR